MGIRTQICYNARAFDVAWSTQICDYG